ncbi:hypothetical protein N7447_003419 [Penicillium robsamsonii]|uniref:uncharacterized protein n=1 Tax=Penicillium robsamsonii TaxID=1792511 RepID=UPI00254945E9|nr:uncharacterized protein N7447_003419 [Penicillium robsamsonii]KAJ5826656.1 hypothetical protein N7447_003419 [Penicillium robsamsonii]
MDPSNVKPIRARRTHRKSRVGCTNCKMRRIKDRYTELPETNSFQCDEKRPACANCSNHSIECGYCTAAQPSESKSPSPFQVSTDRPRSKRYKPHRYATGQLEQTFKLSKPPLSQLSRSTGAQCNVSSGSMETITLPDLKLFHHYIINTYRTMTTGAHLENVWQTHVVQWGVKFPSLLHLILALSALHLAYEQPGLDAEYTEQADKHFTFGMRSVTSVLSELNVENCQKIYMSAIMICFIYFGRGPRPGEYLIFSDNGPAEWLVLMRGVKLILSSHHAKIFSGILEPQHIERNRDLTPEMRTALQEHTVHTERVQRLVERDLVDDEIRGMHLIVIEDLYRTMREVSERRSAGSHGVDLMDLLIGWLYRLPEEMIGLLERKAPHTLVILAHWAVLLRYMDSSWFMKGWAEHLLSGISTYLPEEFRCWIEWPLQQVYRT